MMLKLLNAIDLLEANAIPNYINAPQEWYARR